jgi:hypothetical protein
MQEEPSAKSFFTPALCAPRMTLRPMARLSTRKSAGKTVVGEDATDLARGIDYRIRPVLQEPGFHRLLLTKIQIPPLDRQDFAAFRCEAADDGRTGHAVMPGYEDPFAVEIKERR